MTCQIIDGIKEAQKIKDRIKKDLSLSKLQPCLSVILVGEHEASQIYVERKQNACRQVGIVSKVFRFPQTASQEKIVEKITELNEDCAVDGILLQLPLPKHMNEMEIIANINPRKDVDGLTSTNQGLLALNRPCNIPCTPKGIMTLIESISFSLKGKISAVIGRSCLVGSPIAKLLTHANSTVLHIHSHTLNPKNLTMQADIIVVAAGVHHLVDESWLKPEAVVIDVGIHRVNGKLSGDVDFSRAVEKASFITPVPGGVGPMTIASLLENTVIACKNT